jgi:hypothetical protein
MDSTGRAHAWIRNNILGLVAIFIALGGSAVAAQVADKPGAKASTKADKPGAKASTKVKRGPRGPRGVRGFRGVAGPQGIQGVPGQSATRLFAFIRDPSSASDATVVDYGSGVTSVTEPSSTDGQYVVTFNRPMTNCIVQATAGVGEPAGGTSTANTSIPIVLMPLGTSAEVEVDWKRSDDTADFGVDIDTSFLISAFC